MQSIEFGGLTWIARADRSLWHPETGSLVIADLHLAKSHYFRRAGIPISDKIEQEDVFRLRQALLETAATSLWILGDLVHTSVGASTHVSRCLEALPLAASEIHVIVGNHDQPAARALTETGVCLHPDPTPWGCVTFAHVPAQSPTETACIAGHLHPMVTYRSRRDRLRFPCFAQWGTHQLVLPAFTHFSGGVDIDPRHAWCYPIVDTQVLSPHQTSPTI
ncbi:MAG: ligase-associated DNA damage response endonuclease PdeM [Gammaproteobacteria bacterium]|nr:ligase-associated DNA damage response endonuclease PdeM [Gammaproteobacteria bacterium]